MVATQSNSSSVFHVITFSILISRCKKQGKIKCAMVWKSNRGTKKEEWIWKEEKVGKKR